MEKSIVCRWCNSKFSIKQASEAQCPTCGRKNVFGTGVDEKSWKELDFYPLYEPFVYVKILKDLESLNMYYWVEEPYLEDQEVYGFVRENLISSLDVRLDEIDLGRAEDFLVENIDRIIKDYDLTVDEDLKAKIQYYVKRDFLGYGKIDPLMRDPYIEDISCDGSDTPVFLFHRVYGSLRSNIRFDSEEELSVFVVKLAQRCGKHISVAEPMLDASMPDGSRVQMTFGNVVTAKGSTFSIRKFRSDPITPTDLINFNSMSKEMIAYMWLAVENGVNALIAGGTASGKTSVLNAFSLFIPRESKIVSIEETREINLPHPNWIPGVSRSGFGEVVGGRLVGEIDLFDLMKAALRQRPEYILVGEIRGREAYVLFQAMATGHTTYSTVHADSTKSLIHRLENKPIEIPRSMLQSLDIVLIQVKTQIDNKHVRRCQQIVEIIGVDPVTKEILTNEVFRWDPAGDKFIYSGKSYVLERIRSQLDLNREEMMQEMKRRVEVLDWMCRNNIREFKDVARIVSSYVEKPNELVKEIREGKIIPVGGTNAQGADFLNKSFRNKVRSER
jgi:flagellar protein FlaI